MMIRSLFTAGALATLFTLVGCAPSGDTEAASSTRSDLTSEAERYAGAPMTEDEARDSIIACSAYSDDLGHSIVFDDDQTFLETVPNTGPMPCAVDDAACNPPRRGEWEIVGNLVQLYRETEDVPYARYLIRYQQAHSATGELITWVEALASGSKTLTQTAHCGTD